LRAAACASLTAFTPRRTTAFPATEARLISSGGRGEIAPGRRAIAPLAAIIPAGFFSARKLGVAVD
jgi:hypothetical protein